MINDPKVAKNQKDLSLKQAIFGILLSVCIISGSAWLTFIYYQHIKEKQRSDPAYTIIALVQTSPDREGLKTSHLVEFLDLSIDQPRNLYSFNVQEEVQKLLKIPVIKEATIKKIHPGTIHVDYSLRKPIAYLNDYANAAIDASGIVFPFKPFYTPKNLPEIYLGEEEEGAPLIAWGAKIEGQRKELAFNLFHYAAQYCDAYSCLCCIDVSQAFASSNGQRQIVLLLEDRFLKRIDNKTVLCIYPRLLRLRNDNYQQQLGNYLSLRSYLRQKDHAMPLMGTGTIKRAKTTIIDLRLSELAFIAIES